MLDYEGNAMSPAGVERQREKIMRAPMVVRDREYSFPRTSLSTRVVQRTRIVDYGESSFPH